MTCVFALPNFAFLLAQYPCRYNDATQLVQNCNEEKKPWAFGAILASAWNEAIIKRFRKCTPEGFLSTCQMLTQARSMSTKGSN
ncbi:unnamed protein product [Durusdinium trenchii]|uniref:Secreted protein n=1 Tax=Durusdinium trenchii TaxID=1381693 RepID=A0ABP0K991_9DINO